MKRTVLFALMTALLLMTGCGGGEERGRENFEEFRTTVDTAENLSFTADMKTDDGDSVFEFEVYCEKSKEKTSLEILSPEMIAGFKAHISEEGVALEYDGAVLDVGDITKSGITPLSSLPAVLRAVSSGHIESVRTEETEDESLTAVELLYDEDCVMTVWLDEGDPQQFEIAENGKTVMSCTVDEWQIQ